MRLAVVDAAVGGGELLEGEVSRAGAAELRPQLDCCGLKLVELPARLRHSGQAEPRSFEEYFERVLSHAESCRDATPSQSPRGSRSVNRAFANSSFDTMPKEAGRISPGDHKANKAQMRALARRHDLAVRRVEREVRAAQSHFKIMTEGDLSTAEFFARWAFIKGAYQRADEHDDDIKSMQKRYSELCQDFSCIGLAEVPDLEFHNPEAKRMERAQLLLKYAAGVMEKLQKHTQHAFRQTASHALDLFEATSRSEKTDAEQQVETWKKVLDKREEIYDELRKVTGIAVDIAMVWDDPDQPDD